MRFSLLTLVAAFALAAVSVVHADEPGPAPQPGGDYQYPPADPNGQYENPGAAFQDPATFLVPGQGLPATFQCIACFVNMVGPNYAEVVAQGAGGIFRIWGGPGGAILVGAVNAIKQQTGMCVNLPFLPIPGPGIVVGTGVWAPGRPWYGGPGYAMAPRPLPAGGWGGEVRPGYGVGIGGVVRPGIPGGGIGGPVMGAPGLGGGRPVMPGIGGPVGGGRPGFAGGRR